MKSSIKRMEMLIAILGFVLCFSYQALAQTNSEPNNSSAPITYGLVIDRSGSLRSNINHIIETGRAIVKANQERDETFLITFVSMNKITADVPVTKNKRMLLSALSNLHPEGGKTALIEAIYVSAEYAIKHAPCESNGCRRTLILLSDGEDKGSSTKEEELFNYLETNNIRVLIIGFGELTKRYGGSGPSRRAAEFLKKLAAQSNGKVSFPKNDDELNNSIKELLIELRK